MPDNGANKRCVIAPFSPPKLKKKHSFLIIIRFLMSNASRMRANYSGPLRGLEEGCGTPARKTAEKRVIGASILLATITFWVNEAARLGKKGARRLGAKELVMLSTRSFPTDCD